MSKECFRKGELQMDWLERRQARSEFSCQCLQLQWAPGRWGRHHLGFHCWTWNVHHYTGLYKTQLHREAVLKHWGCPSENLPSEPLENHRASIPVKVSCLSGPGRWGREVRMFEGLVAKQRWHPSQRQQK